MTLTQNKLQTLHLWLPALKGNEECMHLWHRIFRHNRFTTLSTLKRVAMSRHCQSSLTSNGAWRLTGSDWVLFFAWHGYPDLPIQKGLKWLHAWVKRWHLPCTMKRPEESSNVQSLPVEVSGFPSVRTFASASFAVAVVQGTQQFEGTNPKVPQTQTQSHQIDHKLPGLMADTGCHA